MKKIFTVIINLLSFAMIACSIFVLLSVLMTPKGEVPNICGYSFMQVLTGSMEPNIPVNSIIAVKKVELEEIQVNDVISFYSDDPLLQGNVNTHRVIQVLDQEDRISFRTKGDANAIADRYEVRGEKIVGKVIFSSLLLGKIIRLLKNPIIFFPIIIIPLFLITVVNLIKSIKTAKQLLKEEEENAVREAVEKLRKEKELEENALEEKTLEKKC